MKDKLKIITDNTVNELLNEDVILPSSYFQCFDKHAKSLEIDLEDENFEKEISQVIHDEFNEINGYVNHAIEKIDLASQVTLDAQKAIEAQNTDALKNLYKQIKDLQNELQTITDNVYIDYLTKVHNKKWLYHKYLSKDRKYQKDAIAILIDVADYDYITQTYNKLIANNLLIYISKYINNKLKEEGYEIKFSRYLTNKFLVFIEEDDLRGIDIIIRSACKILFSTTLKSNSGIILSPSFNYAIQEVKKDHCFHESLELLLNKSCRP